MPPEKNEFGGDAIESSVESVDRGDTVETEVDRGDTVETEVEETVDTEVEEETETEDEADEDSDSDTDDGSDSDTDNAVEETDSTPDETDETVNKVPLSRLNKEIEKRRLLEARIAELENAPAPQAQAEQTAAKEPAALPFSQEQFEAMQDAMIDGETETGFKLFSEMMQAQAQALTTETMTNMRDEVRGELNADNDFKSLQTAAATLAKEYPMLDSASADADQGLIDEVVEMRDIYASRGQSSADALARAVKIVAAENGLTKVGASIAQAPKKKPVDTAKKTALATKERGKLGGSGGKNGQPEANIADLSDDQFAKLSPEAKAKARGDFV